MLKPFRRAYRLLQGSPSRRGSFIELTRHSLFVAGLLIGLLAAAAPALAHYFGPDRVTIGFETVRDPENDIWFCENFSPPPGSSGLCFLHEPANPCPDEGGSHPSVGQQLFWCGWVADSCGCDPAFMDQEVEILLPEATIAGDLQGCTLKDGWCTTSPTLHLAGTEPLVGETIDSLEGTRNGENFACVGAACDVPLVQGENDFTFWAHSSYGDTSQMASLSAKVDSLGPTVSIPDSWLIWEPLAISVDDASVGVAQVKLTIDGGAYGQRKFTWGNLSLAPGDFIWDRRFGEIIAPIGEYPVTVSATDTLGNVGSASGEIVIPDPDAEAEMTAGPITSSGSDPDGTGFSTTPFSLADLLARLPDGDLAATGGSSGLLDADMESNSSELAPAGPQRAVASSTSGETTSAQTLTSAAPTTISSKGPGSGVLWGAAALAAAGATTAYALARHQARQSQITDMRRKAAATSSSKSISSRIQSLTSWLQARSAPIRAALAAAASAAAEAARQRAADAIRQRNLRLRLEREERLEQAEWREALTASQAPASEPPLDLAESKQQDYAAYEASQLAQAYREFQAQEHASVPIATPVPERSWWQRTVDNVQQAQRSVANWVDQHQAAVAIGVGVVAGVAGVATIVLSGGTATPLVVAAWAGLAAGGTVALGTVGLNAYYNRPLTQNLLRNSALSVGGAVATVGAFSLLTGGLATQAALGAGNAVAGLCLRFQPACARLEPVLQAFDTGEQLWLSAQLAVQTATKDPRAPETALELQLEYMDGGVPGNTAIRELQEEISEAAAKYGDDVLTAAARIVERYGDDAVQLINRHGDAGIAFLAAHEDDAFDLVTRHGDDIVTAFGRYGDEGVTVAEQYGLDFIRRSEKLGTDPTNILSNPPTHAQTPEGWLLGLTDAGSPVNQPLKLNLSQEEIARIAERSVHNQDSALFAIGFAGGVEVPYKELGERHGISYFSAPDDIYRPFKEGGARGDFWQINSHAIEGAIADRKIFVLNVRFSEALDASRSSTSTLAELKLILTGNYLVRSVGSLDVLVPIELLDRYRSIIEGAAPDLLIP